MATQITTFLSADDVAAGYRSAQQLIELLDDPDNPTGALNTALRDAIVARVNGDFEGAISRKYSLPLTVDDEHVNWVKAAILGHAVALFTHYAMVGKPHMLDAYPGVETDYKRALAWLANVRDGVEFIGTSKTVPGAEARTDATLSDEHDGTFNRRRLRGW